MSFTPPFNDKLTHVWWLPAVVQQTISFTSLHYLIRCMRVWWIYLVLIIIVEWVVLRELTHFSGVYCLMSIIYKWNSFSHFFHLPYLSTLILFVQYCSYQLHFKHRLRASTHGLNEWKILFHVSKKKEIMKSHVCVFLTNLFAIMKTSNNTLKFRVFFSAMSPLYCVYKKGYIKKRYQLTKLIVKKKIHNFSNFSPSLYTAHVCVPFETGKSCEWNIGIIDFDVINAQPTSQNHQEFYGRGSGS